MVNGSAKSTLTFGLNPKVQRLMKTKPDKDHFMPVTQINELIWHLWNLRVNWELERNDKLSKKQRVNV